MKALATLLITISIVVALIISAERKEPTPPQSADIETSTSSQATVTYVVDGDTVKVSQNGREETIRLIGIDAPEKSNSLRARECFGDEAATFLQEALPTGSKVQVVADRSQATVDKHGRTLAYIMQGDSDIGATSIENGYAEEHTYAAPYANQSTYRETENEAQAASLGLWERCK